ncbi:MAG: alpha/beta hydrolase family protein [Promethearchaeota archaeon]
MNRVKRLLMNLGLKYVKPKKYDRKIQHIIKDYKLPDPLLFNSGERVISEEQWVDKRRGEILRFYEENIYGKFPSEPFETEYKILEEIKDDLGGLATKKAVKITFKHGERRKEIPVLIHIPNHVKKPVPAFVGIPNWFLGYKKSLWPVKHVIQRGYAVISTRFQDIANVHDDFKHSIHALFYKEGQERPRNNEWGVIGAWAWALIQLINYVESDSDIDQKRVAVLGHSRMGKAALWAGVNDDRFSMVISNNTGCCGAALFRRKIGETITMTNECFPSWYCSSFKQYNDREFDLPIDQHMLIALVAPRPVYIASGQDDIWADPIGEFLSAKYADPVYKLLGTTGLGVNSLPSTNTPSMNRIGYHIAEGGHKMSLYNWDRYIDFADLHL